jgi:hypothetical protein
MCKKVTNSKPYELTFVSFTGLKDTVMDVCRKCAYKEAYGTKGMVKAMRENKIEKEKSN